MRRLASAQHETRNSKPETRSRHRILIAIVLVGALLRGWAAWRLPLDYDEPVYLQAGFDYAEALRAGDWNDVIDYAESREHPPLVKLLYGLGVLTLGEGASWSGALYACRVISAVFGTLAVLLLALVDPLAGGLLAVHTLVVKYTSQAYLEALPHFASLAAVLAFHRSTSSRDRWFWLSALALGLTAAGKYSYFPILFVILYLARWEKDVHWRDMLLYLIVAATTFWLLDPTLWHDPLSRLADSLFFHARYSQSAHVQASGYPWYQPLFWISRSMPSVWHPEVIFYFGFDEIIFLLALIGLYWEWRERRWVVVWVATNLIFLLIWPTKWPQYTLVLVPALCLAAASPVERFYRWFREQETYWDWVRGMLPRPPLSFWVVSAGLILLLVVGYVAHTLQLTLGRLGWSHFTTQSTRLPSNTVYDIIAAPDGQMILGTERGAVIWSPPAATDLPDTWIVFTSENSGLPHNRVLAVARDEADNLWFGTEAGLSRYDGTRWQIYRAVDLGLEQDKVHAVEVGSDGRLWVGTSAGAAVFDGQKWTPFTAATSELLDDFVMSLAITPQPQGDVVWFGTHSGVSRLDTATGDWISATAEDTGLEWGSVAELLIDSSGRLWAGTLGGGLCLWDGEAWHSYRVSNSDIPFNTVQAVFEAEPGILWVGTALPNNVGGVLATFDGKRWITYTPRNSGFSGAEPLAIAQDEKQRVWVGTRTGGVDVYLPQR
ncbi:MAG: transcriptional regulator [Anaerolineae bacterium]|nr:transcriptional regulator [Anaerolineae bacterium]